jgi:predicted transcriptional regulator
LHNQEKFWLVNEHLSKDNAAKANSTKTAEAKRQGAHRMAGQYWPSGVDPNQVTKIVSSYVRHHKIGADQLAGLIVEVHRALAGLGRAPPMQAPSKPAVPIRSSVERDYVICLECGYRARTLRRHLRGAHGLDVTNYRTRWNLPADYPLIAPSYSARRSTIAKEIGLGRKPSGLATPPTSARRGRKRRTTPAG